MKAHSRHSIGLSALARAAARALGAHAQPAPAPPGGGAGFDLKGPGVDMTGL